MASFQSFEEMVVWQKARSLANRIYDLRFETIIGTDKPYSTSEKPNGVSNKPYSASDKFNNAAHNPNSIPGKRYYDFAFQDQIRRSALSIMANIAEGQGRRTDRDFANFLSTAHASASETRSHLYLALDRKYVSEREFNELRADLIEIGRMLMGMMRHLRKSS